MSVSVWQSLPSLVDRLIDDQPLEQWDSFRSQTTAQILQSLERDLNDLILTRRALPAQARIPDVVAEALPGYGMPDLTSFSLSSPDHRARLRRELEHALRSYEPRLSDIRVSESVADAASGRVGFTVVARLKVEPRPLAITFNAEMSLAKEWLQVRMGETSITGG